MIPIYDFSVFDVSFYKVYVYDSHIWFPYMISVYLMFHFIKYVCMMLTYDQSYMIVTCDYIYDHIYEIIYGISYMIIYGTHIWSYTVFGIWSHIWSLFQIIYRFPMGCNTVNVGIIHVCTACYLLWSYRYTPTVVNALTHTIPQVSIVGSRRG